MDKVVAIDGPSASGKSTVAREVARTLGWIYVDSGALYRAVAWKALQEALDPQDEIAVTACVAGMEPQFSVQAGAVMFTIEGRTPGAELRTEAVNRAVSPVAANPAVRQSVTTWLHDMRSLGALVMEGRDIGTAVFPSAPYKFYLDAAPEERARRRHAEMADVLSVDDVGASLQRRDMMDSRRMTAPLKIATDAHVIDSTGQSIAEVSQRIVAHVQAGQRE